MGDPVARVERTGRFRLRTTVGEALAVGWDAIVEMGWQADAVAKSPAGEHPVPAGESRLLILRERGRLLGLADHVQHVHGAPARQDPKPERGRHRDGGAEEFERLGVVRPGDRRPLRRSGTPRRGGSQRGTPQLQAGARDDERPPAPTRSRAREAGLVQRAAAHDSPISAGSPGTPTPSRPLAAGGARGLAPALAGRVLKSGASSRTARVDQNPARRVVECFGRVRTTVRPSRWHRDRVALSGCSQREMPTRQMPARWPLLGGGRPRWEPPGREAG